MTNRIEDRLREAFEARAAAVAPREGARADQLRRLRRDRIRRRALVPAVAAVTAAAAASPFVLHGLPDGGPGPPLAAERWGALTELVEPASAVRIATRVPGGGTFQAETLGADGTVLGRTADSELWRAGARGGTPRAVGVRAQSGLAAGEGIVTWIRPGGVDLECLGAPKGGGPQSAQPDQPVWTDRGVIVWNDAMDQPSAARGCDGRGTTVPQHGRGGTGRVVAFSHPTVFAVSTRNDGVLREIDVTTGNIKIEHPLPAGVRPDGRLSLADGGGDGLQVEVKALPEQDWQATANERYFAWAVDGVLRVADREKWTRQGTRAAFLEPARDGTGSLTAGDRVIAYTASGPGGRATSVVYDTRLGKAVERPGEVYAAGDWLLWRHGLDYRLARVR